MRRSSRMTSEATSRVPVVAHRPAATPKLLDEIARRCPPLLRSVTLLVPSPTRSRRPTPRPHARQACRYSRRPQVDTGWGGARWPVMRLSRRSRVAAAPRRVRTWAALAWVDERVGHSAAEPTGQERQGPAAGAEGEDRGARAPAPQSGMREPGAPPPGRLVASSSARPGWRAVRSRIADPEQARADWWSAGLEFVRGGSGGRAAPYAPRGCSWRTIALSAAPLGPLAGGVLVSAVSARARIAALIASGPVPAPPGRSGRAVGARNREELG
jgi:hypothetical protein